MLVFPVQVGNMVGRVDPRTGKVELKAVQGQRALPYGIAINSKGVPFFCEFGTNKIAKIDPQTMTITDFTLPEAARPRRMALDAQDRIYFTDYEGGHLGRLDPATGAVKMWASPAGEGAAPYGQAITPHGAVRSNQPGLTPNPKGRSAPH